MAAPSVSVYGPDGEQHFLNAAAATVTMDLPAPSADVQHVIDKIGLFMLGTVTVFTVEIQNAAAAVLARFGGQIGGATNGQLPTAPIEGPWRGQKGDATKIVLTATGATQVSLSVSARKK